MDDSTFVESIYFFPTTCPKGSKIDIKGLVDVHQICNTTTLYDAQSQ